MMLRPRSSTAGLLFTLALSTLSLAAEPDPGEGEASPALPALLPLEHIHVYGQHRGLHAHPDTAEMARRLAERPGGTAVVAADHFRDRRTSTLTDALGHAPGVFIQPRFGSSEARLSIRGSGLQRTYHMRGIRLLQDGAPISLADGSGDFEALEPLALTHIEVYRGANAMEYGAASLGGAINFVSPTGHDADPLTLRLEGGRFGYRRSQLGLAGVWEDLDTYVSLSSFRQDGYRHHAEQENYRLFANAGYRFSDQLDGRLYLTQVHNRSALPGSLSWAEFRQDPRQAAGDALDGDQRRDFRLTRMAGRLGWSPAPGQELVLTAHVADKSLDHPIYQVLMQDSLDQGLTAHYRLDGQLAGHRSVLTTGINLGRTRVNDRRYLNRGGHRGALLRHGHQRASQLELFINQQLYFTPDLAASLGLQWSRSGRRSSDRLQSDGVDHYRANYYAASPRLGLLWQPLAPLQLFANVSRSHEPPSFGELAGGAGVSLVNAQRATTWELGSRLDTERLQVDLALYHAETRGELLSLSDERGQPLGTVNADRTRHQGLELSWQWQLHPQLTFRGNGLWNEFRFHRDRVYGNNRLAGVPGQQWRLELKWSTPGGGLYLAPNLEWTPRATWVDHANRASASRYTLLGLRIGGNPTPEWSWFIDGRNLTGRSYIATTGVVDDSGGVDGAWYLPGDGRAVYLGLEWRPQRL